MRNAIMILIGLVSFAYGMYLPGLEPGIYFTMAGGAFMGLGLASLQNPV